MPSQIIPKKGDVYNGLTLTGVYEMRSHATYAEALCECGKLFFSRFKHIRIGKATSCGCKTVQLRANKLVTHGFGRNANRHPLYRAWSNMKSRCFNVKNSEYHNYGGRGIKMCKEWCDNFTSFCEWAINNGWRKGLSIDRIKVNGNYEPTNCRWATIEMQNNNRRDTVFISAFGEVKNRLDWSKDKRTQVKMNVVAKRLTLGWDAEIALTKKLNLNYARHNHQRVG